MAPAQGLQASPVHRVAPVVAGPILHLPDERPRLAQQLEQLGDNVAVRPFRAAHHVVRLAGGAVAQDVIHRRRVVGDEQPVAPLQAIAVQRQRQVVERIGDEQRDQLLGMLVRAVGIGARVTTASSPWVIT